MDERALLLDDAVIRNMLPTLGRSLTSVTYAALEHELGEARDLALSVVYIGGELILRFKGVEQPVVVTWLRTRDGLTTSQFRSDATRPSPWARSSIGWRTSCPLGAFTSARR